MKILRKQADPAQRAAIVELVEELKTRFGRAENVRQDVFYAELLALLDEFLLSCHFFEKEMKNQTSNRLGQSIYPCLLIEIPRFVFKFALMGAGSCLSTFGSLTKKCTILHLTTKICC